jgi:hypothetical protein
VDLMLQIQLERGVDGMKCCQNMKRRQQARIGYMGKKRDMTRRRDDVSGGEVTPRRGKGGDDTSWADMNLTRPKNEKNSCSRFSCYK